MIYCILLREAQTQTKILDKAGYDKEIKGTCHVRQII